MSELLEIESGSDVMNEEPAVPVLSRTAFALVFFALLTMGFGNSIVFTTVPPIIRELNLSDVIIAPFFTIPSLIAAGLSPFWGRASDRIGRRPVMLIGMIGLVSSGFLIAFSAQAGLYGILTAGWAFSLMVFARCLFGILTPGLIPAGQAYIAERTTRKERTGSMAAIGASLGVGVAVGPAIGGGLAVLGLTVPFYAFGAFSFLVFVVIWLFLKEERLPFRDNHSSGPQAWLSPLDPRVLPFVLCTLLHSLSLVAMVSTIGFYFADRLGLEGKAIAQYAGMGFTVHASATLISQLILVRIFKPNPQTLLRLGPFVALVGFLFLMVADNFLLLVGALFCHGIGMGLLMPGMISGLTLSVEDHELGAAGGLSGAVMPVGFAIGPIIAILLYEVWLPAPFLLGALLMLVTFGVGWFHPSVKALAAIKTEPH